MNTWVMLTIIGKDQPGIVAKVTTALYENKHNLGETSMLRLGSNFVIMMMVSSTENKTSIASSLQAVSAELGLKIHIDDIGAALHQHGEANIRVTVSSADRAGIIAQITTILNDNGFSILDLESDVGGSSEQPLYIMHIEGYAEMDMSALQQQIENNIAADVDVRLTPIETLIG